MHKRKTAPTFWQPSLFGIHNGSTLEAYQECACHIRAQPGGGTCPVCGLHIENYKTTLSRQMCETMKWMYNHAQDGWINMQDETPRIIVTTNTHGKLIHWGLLESKNPATFRLTPKGIQFISGQLQVHEYGIFFNNKLEGWSPNLISFDQAVK